MLSETMSISLDTSGLAVAQVVGRTLLHLHAAICWLLSSLLALCPMELQDGAGAAARRPRVSARAIKESLQVVTYGDIMDASGEGGGCHHHQIREEAGGAEEGDEDCGLVTCAVCLNGLEREDEVRELRNCRHVFHRGCLDRWLDHDEHGTCPLCRAPLLLSCLPDAAAWSYPPSPPAEPSWAVDRLLYLFADDMLLCAPASL